VGDAARRRIRLLTSRNLGKTTARTEIVQGDPLAATRNEGIVASVDTNISSCSGSDFGKVVYGPSADCTEKTNSDTVDAACHHVTTTIFTPKTDQTARPATVCCICETSQRYAECVIAPSPFVLQQRVHCKRHKSSNALICRRYQPHSHSPHSHPRQNRTQYPPHHHRTCPSR